MEDLADPMQLQQADQEPVTTDVLKAKSNAASEAERPNTDGLQSQLVLGYEFHENAWVFALKAYGDLPEIDSRI